MVYISILLLNFLNLENSLIIQNFSKNQIKIFLNILPKIESLYIFEPKVVINEKFAFQGGFKKWHFLRFFTIFWEIAKDLLFEKQHPETDLRHLFQMIKAQYSNFIARRLFFRGSKKWSFSLYFKMNLLKIYKIYFRINFLQNGHILCNSDHQWEFFIFSAFFPALQYNWKVLKRAKVGKADLRWMEVSILDLFYEEFTEKNFNDGKNFLKKRKESFFKNFFKIFCGE